MPLTALGFVPHMLFLSSFVAIGLHRGVAAGAGVMAWLGVAAALGPVILGRVADRFGFLPTLAAGYVVMALAVALPLVNASTVALDISAIGVGAVGLGAVMLAAGAIAGLVPAHRLAADWGVATMAYAVAQALTAAGFSNLFHLTGSYALLFIIGALAMVVSRRAGERGSALSGGGDGRRIRSPVRNPCSGRSFPNRHSAWAPGLSGHRFRAGVLPARVLARVAGFGLGFGLFHAVYLGLRCLIVQPNCACAIRCWSSSAQEAFAGAWARDCLNSPSASGVMVPACSESASAR